MHVLGGAHRNEGRSQHDRSGPRRPLRLSARRWILSDITSFRAHGSCSNPAPCNTSDTRIACRVTHPTETLTVACCTLLTGDKSLKVEETPVGSTTPNLVGGVRIRVNAERTRHMLPRGGLREAVIMIQSRPLNKTTNWADEE